MRKTELPLSPYEGQTKESLQWHQVRVFTLKTSHRGLKDVCDTKLTWHANAELPDLEFVDEQSTTRSSEPLGVGREHLRSQVAPSSCLLPIMVILWARLVPSIFFTSILYHSTLSLLCS